LLTVGRRTVLDEEDSWSGGETWHSATSNVATVDATSDVQWSENGASVGVTASAPTEIVKGKDNKGRFVPGNTYNKLHSPNRRHWADVREALNEAFDPQRYVELCELWLVLATRPGKESTRGLGQLLEYLRDTTDGKPTQRVVSTRATPQQWLQALAQV